MTTGHSFQPRTTLRDVTLRDGLQLTGKQLPTERKAAVVRELLRLGVPSVEIGSLARPDLVPSMANTLEVVEELTADELARCWVWVATPRHVQRAAQAGAVNFQYCLSASDKHNQANLGRSTEDSLTAMPKAVEHARDAGGRIQLCVATAFTCPFDGYVPARRVLDIATDPRTAGAADIVVCDTLGQAVPAQVTDLISRIAQHSPPRRIVYHGHDTWGLGVANSLAAAAAGAGEVDGALGGLGGCPFAPGAGGNAATEDLLFALRPDWLTPAAFARLVELSGELLDELGEPNRSRAAQGARSSATAFPWALAPAQGTCR
ncbi:hydroxymethylglutaryl-CoA lyase [Saccharopolyspora erythraea NRRL 2338]|uniref:Hydroxymethylglutaryl-CoA lyase n=2 Tax=Saccharopolyspora erythraea TaxID=1836 RepID=A4FHV4_SACEN|nr:hydroxymethylglutaryl-CoA lyase [Saccharopolyspora erythraea]EQD84288.1 hydroxymethylglutaryl-CoA lyase [Saccharopolyspora erythraea D]PFG97315.1 hydroxymethylglutaryl-CoA lyase [Saccharopolyspora erythraea NRRL 2338]QRK87503.1 hydroxymethylglutaryl-CoA lyase [Saccharopolyspora erythraea]CAM03629.1 hydroxymethylglutaryl-CoA lyase [Saccharopolyspora erythraea NRRL 2338]